MTQREFNVCTTCEVRHFDNCPDCIGFGVLGMNLPSKAPVSARVAEVFRSGRRPFDGMLAAFPCPTCGSTIAGLPGTTLALIPHPTLYGKRQREWITDEAYARRIAIAHIDGAYLAVERIFGRTNAMYPSMASVAHQAAHPRFHELRDFLMWDEHIEPVLAATIAMQFTRHHP